MQIGMGWLGWTEQQTLDTSIPAIELAYEGKLEVMRVAQFGPQTPAAPSPPPPSGKSVMAIIRSAGKPRHGLS